MRQYPLSIRGGACTGAGSAAEDTVAAVAISAS
jgi:hypothetical protein